MSLFLTSRLAGAPDRAVDFLSNILQASTEYSIICIDLNGTVLLWSEGARRLYGYEPEEVVDTVNIAILYPPEVVATGKPQLLLDFALNEGKWEGTIQHLRRGGEYFNTRLVITPYLDVSGVPVGYVLISNDASGDIGLTEQFNVAQLDVHSVIESNIDALMTTDPMGIITDVNKQMELLTCYQRKDLIGTPFKDYFTDGKLADEGIILFLRDGRVTNHELTARRRDGRETVVSYNACTINDAKGELLGIFVSVRDITAQKQLEVQLQASQFYTRTLIESSIDALMTTDPLGIITDVNQQMAVLTGYAREELVGTPFKTYFTDPQRAEQGIFQVLCEGKITNYELSVRAKDGKETVVSYNATTFNDRDGKLQGVFAAARDVNERKRFVQALQEKILNWSAPA